MKTNYISIRVTFVTAAIVSFASLPAIAQSGYRVLHHFAGAPDDGAGGALGTLIQCGSSLYGMTPQGGSNDVGTVFKIGIDGTGYALIHSFGSAAGDGSRPYGSLLLSGSMLYGMAASENTGYGGTIFRINTDTLNFQVLHSFAGSQGKWPYDSLIQSGSILYGMCAYGGNDTGPGWVGNGTIFRFNTNGSSFELLRTFAGGGDGSGPHGSLTQSGTTFYGTTLAGGSHGLGTVFKINADGTGFQIAHHFAGDALDGSGPYGTTLARSGPTLYGMTKQGGGAGNGALFKMNTDGTGFEVLHSFAGGANDGCRPMCGTLALSGSTLYGLTTFGGIGNTNGTIFQIQTDGTRFQLLHRFNGIDGRQPWGSPFISGSTLYGKTEAGGSHDKGVIFALDIAPK